MYVCMCICNMLPHAASGGLLGAGGRQGDAPVGAPDAAVPSARLKMQYSMCVFTVRILFNGLDILSVVQLQ